MGSHKKKSRRHSRSRSRSSDDHQPRQNSRISRRRSSSSSSTDSPRRHGRSSRPTRYRSRSRSHSPPSRRRSRSRSREDRKRHRRSRSHSRSRRSHSRRRSRSRSRSRDRRRRSRSNSRSRHSSRKCSPTERDKLKGKQAKDEKSSGDPAPSDMLKVKMQKALENAASSTAASTESTSAMKSVNEDDPEMRKELKRIEKDSFRQTAFKSSRWDLNAPKPTLTARPMSIDQSHDSAIFGGSAMNGSAHHTLQHPNVAAILYRPNWKLTCESLRASPKEKMDRWVEKLQMWRKKRIDEAHRDNT